MRKVNLNDVEERERQSPKGKFGRRSKDISIALGRDPESLDLSKRHPFDLALVSIPKGKSLCPYHSHSSESELYLVVSGRGNVRDKNGWTEVDGCPLYTDDDFPKSVQQMEDILGKYGDLDAFVPTGGFPQFLPDAYEKVASKYKAKIASGALALVVADTLPVQITLMKKGLSAGQVGQRPFEMGYKAMYFLKDIKDGKASPNDPTYTGLDVCTPKTADTCVGGGS